jgi:hypothetical protein
MGKEVKGSLVAIKRTDVIVEDQEIKNLTNQLRLLISLVSVELAMRHRAEEELPFEGWDFPPLPHTPTLEPKLQRLCCWKLG